MSFHGFDHFSTPRGDHQLQFYNRRFCTGFGSSAGRRRDRRPRSDSESSHDSSEGYDQTVIEDVTVRANYFKVVLSRLEKVHFYTLAVGKAKENASTSHRNCGPRVTRQIIFNFLASDFAPKVPCASNYSNLLVTNDRLPPEYLRDKKIFKYVDEDGMVKREAYIQLTSHSELEYSDLHRYLNGYARPDDEDMKNSFIEALNIFFSQYPNIQTQRNLIQKREPQMANVGSSRFFMLDSGDPHVNGTQSVIQDLGHGLQATLGFQKNVRMTKFSHALINVNRGANAFYKPGNLFDLITEFKTVQSNITQRELRNISSFISGLRIKTTYFGISKSTTRTRWERIFTLDGLAEDAFFPSPDRVYFDWTHKTEDTQIVESVTVQQYFEQKHGIHLDRSKLVVKSGGHGSSKRKEGNTDSNGKQKSRYLHYIPAEYCEVLSGQIYPHVLTEKQTDSMIKFADMSPADSVSVIENQGMRLIGARGRMSVLHSLRLSVLPAFDPRMIETEGRMLLSPCLRYRLNAIKPSVTRMGKWKLRSTQMAISPGTPIPWSILVLKSSSSGTLNGEDLNKYFGGFKDSMMTYDIPNRKIRSGNQDRHCIDELDIIEDASWELQCQKKLEEKLWKFKGYGVKLLLVLLLDTCHDNMYALVKRTGDCIIGLHTVCMAMEYDQKHNLCFSPTDHAGNMAKHMLEINVKMGGTNHLLDELSFEIFPEDTMFVSMKVAHPQAGSLRNAPSVAAVVASVDNRFSQWPASMRLQRRDADTIVDTKEMVIERLNYWKKVNDNKMPKNIIIYRDDVSEIHFDQVRNCEIPEINHAVDTVYLPGARPQILYLCACQRHGTRFYPTNFDSESVFVDSKTGNMMPGLVVSGAVAAKAGSDWYQQSHAVTQGTAVPTRYTVLFRDMAMSNLLGLLSEEQIQQMTHYMCFTFQGASGAISIHPAAYHAHLVCMRVQCWMRRVYHPFAPGDYQGQLGPEMEQPHPDLKDTMYYI